MFGKKSLITKEEIYVGPNRKDDNMIIEFHFNAKFYLCNDKVIVILDASLLHMHFIPIFLN